MIISLHHFALNTYVSPSRLQRRSAKLVVARPPTFLYYYVWLFGLALWCFLDVCFNADGMHAPMWTQQLLDVGKQHARQTSDFHC